MPVDRVAELDLEEYDIVVRGNVKINFFDWDQVGSDDKVRATTRARALLCGGVGACVR